MSPSNPQKEYLANSVTAASPAELIRMLYEAAAEAVEQALEALGSGDILRRGNAVSKALEILSELRLSLRREVDPAYCDTLSGLYGYLQRQLIRAHADKSEGAFREVQRLLHTLLEGWVGAMQNLDAHPSSSGVAETSDARRSAGSSPSYESIDAKTQPRSWQF
jgi:flagellar secretion chaperone FliS